MHRHSPKAEFLRNTEARDAFRKILDMPAFEQAITYALAQFATGSRCREELAGANSFVGTLLTLPVQEPDPSPPSKTLKTY